MIANDILVDISNLTGKRRRDRGERRCCCKSRMPSRSRCRCRWTTMT